MNRQLRASPVETDWRYVSEKNPCPICGAEAGCRTLVDDDFACCERTPSEWPLTTGAWLHRIEGTPSDGAAAVGVETHGVTDITAGPLGAGA
jgi:hypothetical protein